MACSQVSVEEKKGISRLEQVVEEISEAERAKEMKREQKRLKKKARRREKCKSNGDSVNGEQKDLEPKQNGTENDHGSPDELEGNCQEESWDDEDDRDSVDTPCSCEDLQCMQRAKRGPKSRGTGDCGYVSEIKVWSGREIRNGVGGMCCHPKSEKCARCQSKETEGVEVECWEDVCSSCLCPQEAEIGSQKSGKPKKGKSGNTKSKKVC